MDEEKKGFYLSSDFLIKILFLAMFVLILMWLFPISKNVSNIKPLTDRIFIENIKEMKEAAKPYYTNDKLPKEIGDKVGMTLQTMFDRKMLIQFVDSKGNSCDTQNSYVEVSKASANEYVLKAYLSCDGYTDYVLEPMGCYDKCCNNKEVANNDNNKPKPVKKSKIITEYEYIKTLAKDTWSAFGDWTEEFKTTTDSLKREEKTLVMGRKKVGSDEWSYEFSRNVLSDTWTSWSDWIDGYSYMNSSDTYQIENRNTTKSYYSDWGAWSAWSQTYPTPYGTSDLYQIESRTSTISGDPIYGSWNWVSNVVSFYPLTSTLTVKYELITDFYPIKNCTCGTECCTITYGYQYSKYVRTKTVPTTNITEYRIHYRTYTVATVHQYRYRSRGYTTQYQWFTSPYMSGWTRTSTSPKLISSYDYIYTDWLDSLPYGYSTYKTKKLYRYSTKSTSSQVEYTWSTKSYLNGWTKTGNTKSKTIYY